MKVLSLISLALLMLTVSGCVNRAGVSYGDEGRYYSGGPPPHAPAHGYRAKHRHHDMVYDSRLRAYVVLGYNDHYYNDGWYFRYRDGGWQINADLRDRDWRDVDRYRVPEGLRHSKSSYREREYRDYRNDGQRGKARGKGYDKDEPPGQGRGRGNGNGRDKDWDD